MQGPIGQINTLAHTQHGSARHLLAIPLSHHPYIGVRAQIDEAAIRQAGLNTETIPGVPE